MPRYENGPVMEQISVVDSLRTLGPGLLYICNQSAEQREIVGDDAAWVQAALSLPDDEIKVVRLADGEKLPDTIEEQRIIIGGSPYAAYEDLPWIHELSDAIPKIHDLGTATLGICFGHQIIARGLGGRVERNPLGYEFGSQTVYLNEQGRADPLFNGVDTEVSVAQSHSDVVTELPTGQHVELLATNAMGIQAVSYGDHMKTVQFHPELRPDILGPLAQKRKDRLMGRVVSDEAEFEELIERIMRDNYRVIGQVILSNFYHGIT